MSLDILNNKIRVYNFERSPIGFPSNHDKNGVFLRGREEDEDFVVERVAFDDIEAENSKADVFKVGRLRFHQDEEDEIYQKLGIEDRENIMTDKMLIEFLMTDTIENVKRISNLKSLTLISRMKAMLFTLERSGKIPPHRISATIIERGHELISGGKRNPNSEINKILEADKKSNEDGKLKDTLEEMKLEIQKLKNEKEAEAKVKDDLLAKSQMAIEELLKKVESMSHQQTYKEPKQVGRPSNK